MLIFSRKSRKRIASSPWSKLFLFIGIVQILVTIPILVTTLVRIETDVQAKVVADTNDPRVYLLDKVVRVRIENIWFILYEIWRLWIVTDGIIHFNSLTIIAATTFAYFSGALGLMQIIETIKWTKAGDTNLYLQVAMTIVVFCLALPTTFVAFKLFKDIGWNVYRRIGPDVRLQNMYYTVQCFTLALKIDIFFEVLLLAFYSVCTMINPALWVTFMMLAIINFITLFLGRKAIADELHWLMSLVSLFQTAVIFINLAVLVSLTIPHDVWYTMTIYACASMVVSVFTLFMAVRCQINFGRGLKGYVQWRPFKKSGKNIDVDASRQSQQLLNHFGNSPGSGGDAIDVPQSPERPSWMIEDDDVVPTHPPPPPPHSSPPPPLPAHSDAYHGKRQSADSSEYYYLVHRDRYPA
ncbi:hypothetical protein VTP01DRAFT_6108 [Rhizomucor pusillus]|uniref:uncharacterized protein n=1 Tax=Rhizomucor pusillus TaxID=4840 RepID=UPI0037438A79